MKNLIYCAFILAAQMTFAQTQGPLSGGSFTTSVIAGSNKTWTSTSDASPSDNVYTSFGNLNGGVGSYTDYLVASDFGFSVPAGCVISGILVEVERSDVNRKTSDYSVRIVKAKTITGAERASGMVYPAGDTYESFGSSSDLWGETWTDADINDNGFGVAIAAQRSEAGSTTDGMIDDVRITVFYNFNTLPVTLLQFSAQKKETGVDVKWTTMQEVNMAHYEIERSSNGRDFSFVTRINSRNQLSPSNYTARDNSPLTGVSYYRLKMVGVGGDVSFSRIVSVQTIISNPVAIYPSHWVKGQPLYIVNPTSAKYTVVFVNDAGQILGNAVTKTGNVNTNALTVQKGLISYKVLNEKGETVGSGRLLIK